MARGRGGERVRERERERKREREREGERERERERERKKERKEREGTNHEPRAGSEQGRRHCASLCQKCQTAFADPRPPSRVTALPLTQGPVVRVCVCVYVCCVCVCVCVLYNAHM
jgi:hypothetical protein